MSKLHLTTVFVGIAGALVVCAYYFQTSSSEQMSASLPREQVQEQTTTAKCDPARTLVGKWNETDNLSGYTVQFNLDGTFADERDGIVATFNTTTRSFGYVDVNATSTGRWSIVTDQLKEIADWKLNYSNFPLAEIPKEGTILKEDFDLAPWYYQVLLSDDCKRMAQIATWIEGDSGTKYQKAQ